MTSIIIPHRLTTFKDCDRIIVMGDGEIKEIGKHDELMAQDSLYKELWERQ